MNSLSENEQFDSIRAYNNADFPEVFSRIVNDKDCHTMLLKYALPHLPKIFYSMFRPIVAFKLKRYFKHTKTIEDFQEIVKKYVETCIKKSTSNFHYSQLQQHLENKSGYVFFSNHRDIVMDPAFTNFAIYQQGFSTFQIAIGNNLLQKKFVSDLMRLNKSFIVERSNKGIKETYNSLKNLSLYIQSVRDNKQNIWIAHREGRAKDGNDKTEAAILKMLHMAERKNLSLKDFINSIGLVPVAISYEYDPCDTLKAQELACTQSGQTYIKQQGEDLRSITKGIVGFKGLVSINFAPLFKTESNDVDEIAKQIDKQIHQHFRLMPTHLAAYTYITEQSQNKAHKKLGDYSDFQIQSAMQELTRRAKPLEANPLAQDLFFSSYAKPVFNYLLAHETD